MVSTWQHTACRRVAEVPGLILPARIRRALWLVGFVFCLGWLLSSREAHADWLDRWLQGGQVAPAIEQARRLPTPAEASDALRRVAAWQRSRGDVEGADRTLQYLPDRQERSRERERGVRAPRDDSGSGQGGASVADFSELIDLITSTVSPSTWESLGGVGSVRPFVSGVFVDPRGVLQQAAERIAPFPQLELLQPPRAADPPGPVDRPSTLRVVSLRRLERVLADRLETGLLPTREMLHLAGLYRLEGVAVRKEQGDILLFGPASGWRYDTESRAVSTESDLPALCLDDLVVLLRSARGDLRRGVFGCSINTRDANLARLRDFVADSNRQGPLAPGQLRRWLKELQQRLGRQDVVIQGIPHDSRVALVLVAADYRMKLIGVGQVDGGDGIPDYFELLKKARLPDGPPLEALRWWLTMGYRQISHDPGRSMFQLEKGAVLAQSENQFIAAQGQRVPTGMAEPVNREFAANLTRHFDALAARDLVFGDLRNVFDLALAATLFEVEGWWNRCQWDGGVLGRPGAYPLAAHPVPREVESVVAHRVYQKRQIVVQVAGGVQVDLPSLLRQARPAEDLPPITGGDASDVWWWDVSRQ